MKWFQQHSNALYDPRVIKLIKKHGMAGFGVYIGINILIAEKDKEDLTLEHDLDDLEAIFNEINTTEIIETCLKYGLFTKNDGRIQNLKIAKYIGNWERRTKRYGVTTETLQRPSVQKEEKEVREEKERIEVKKGKYKNQVVNADINQTPKKVQIILDKIMEYHGMLQNAKYGDDQRALFKAEISRLEKTIQQ